MLDNWFVFFPSRDVDGTPADYGMAYEDARFAASDGTGLHGWFVPGGVGAGGSLGVTLLWCHGNAGNVGHRLADLRRLHDGLDVSILLFDYRGYGHSEGAPSEQGLYLDADAALEYLAARGDVDMGRVVYYGRSLGGGVAVDLAVRRPPLALILESTFPSIAHLAHRVSPALTPWVVERLVGARFDSAGKIARVTAPLLMVHGDADATAPLSAGRALYDAATPPKAFHVVEGAAHNNLAEVGGAAYVELLRAFLQALPSA